MRTRLGKIEKHILIWSYQQHDSYREFHSKTGAILSYVRSRPGFRIPHHTYNLKALLSEKEYKNLHVSFYRALKSLAAKNLVEYKYCPDPELYIEGIREENDLYGHIDFLGISRSYGTVEKRYIRKSIFRLTGDGRKKVRMILEQSSQK